MLHDFSTYVLFELRQILNISENLKIYIGYLFYFCLKILIFCFNTNIFQYLICMFCFIGFKIFVTVWAFIEYDKVSFYF